VHTDTTRLKPVVFEPISVQLVHLRDFRPLCPAVLAQLDRCRVRRVK